MDWFELDRRLSNFTRLLAEIASYLMLWLGFLFLFQWRFAEAVFYFVTFLVIRSLVKTLRNEP